MIFEGEVVLSSSSSTTTNKPTSSPSLSLIWSDEFNNNEIDFNKWELEILKPYSYNNELQYYTKS